MDIAVAGIVAALLMAALHYMDHYAPWRPRQLSRPAAYVAGVGGISAVFFGWLGWAWAEGVVMSHARVLAGYAVIVAAAGVTVLLAYAADYLAVLRRERDANQKEAEFWERQATGGNGRRKPDED